MSMVDVVYRLVGRVVVCHQPHDRVKISE